MPRLSGRTEPAFSGFLHAHVELGEDEPRVRAHPGFDEVRLARLDKASRFGDDMELGSSVGLLRLLRSIPAIVNALYFAVDTTPQQIEPLPGEERYRPIWLRRMCGEEVGDDEVDPQPDHRSRMPGHWGLLHAAWIAEGTPSLLSFYRQRVPQLARLCGFRQVPSYSLFARRIAEHDESWERVRDEVVAPLIRRAIEHEPQIGKVVWVDATRFVSAFRPQHACPDPEQCAAATERNREAGLRDPVATWLQVAEQAEIAAAHHAEARVPDPVEGELPLTVVRPVEAPVDDGHQYFDIGGHLYRCRDTTLGLRTYGSGKSWPGGLAELAIDVCTDLAMAGTAFPADEAEFDHFPDIWKSLCDLRDGEPPLIIIADGHYGTADMNRFCQLRQTALVAPIRPRPGYTQPEDWRTVYFDEDGIPRCAHCGGESQHLGPETRGEEPGIRFRCLTPHTDACVDEQWMACRLDPAMLSLLPRTSELYDAASEHGFDQERAINQQRQRHGICGKEAATRLMRWNSVPAQRVNIQFAIMLDWVRLNAQYGWFREGELSDVGADDDPRPIEMRRQPRSVEPMLRNFSRRREHDKRIAARRANAVELPYGPQAVALGLAPSDAWPVFAQMAVRRGRELQVAEQARYNRQFSDRIRQERYHALGQSRGRRGRGSGSGGRHGPAG